MKHTYIAVAISAISMASCQKYLDRTPESQVTPTNYLNEESQLAAYAIGAYSVLPSHSNWSYGAYGNDASTDNQVTPSMSNIYAPGQYLVGATGGNWEFTSIYNLNYFLDDVMPKFYAGKITGTTANIQHYIGEVFFLRAFNYFNKMQAFGDFPIIRDTLGLNNQTLIDSSKRQPMTEVARFILSDLDSASKYMLTASPDGKKNRLSKYCAELFKSRVALYTGTWLKYFKGTAFVPNGTNWPGATKTYNQNYQFPSGSIDGEIKFFLSEAMTAAKDVADNNALVSNTGLKTTATGNPYLNMFGDVDMSGYSEVLLWRQYNASIITHAVPQAAASNDYAVGVTRSMVESYVMSNGLPIYASASGYQGDDSIQPILSNRDGRLQLFLKAPRDTNVLTNANLVSNAYVYEPYPLVTASSWTTKYTTGYSLRKGINFDGTQDRNGAGYTGCIVFRSAEALLNYMEADYELNGSVSSTSATYWAKLRARANVNTDYTTTVSATNMTKETADLGSYSAGSQITPTLYNIRRERRDELISEGLRMMDLRRWRSLDQLINTAYHVEGFKLWGPMKNWYSSSALKYGASSSSSVVSDPALSNYLRPFEILSTAISYNGMKWRMAHYLEPIAVTHFTMTATNGDLTTSPIYQNPGWTTTAGSGATE